MNIFNPPIGPPSAQSNRGAAQVNGVSDVVRDAIQSPRAPFVAQSAATNPANMPPPVPWNPETGQPSLLANAAVIALWLVYYFAIVRRRGAWVLSGPADGG